MNWLESSTIRAAAWVVARGISQALEFLAWIVFARRLGASAVGLIAVAAVTARLLGLLGDWGATWRGPRDVAAHGRGSPVVVSLVRLRELVSASLAVSMGIVLLTVGQISLMPISVVVIARGANRDWIALGEGRRTHSALPLLLQGSILVLLAIIIPATAGASALALCIGNAAGLLLSRGLSPVQFVGPARSTVVDAWYLVAGVADQVTASAGVALLLVLRDAQQAGIYNTVHRMPLAWLTVVGLSVTVAVPMVTRLSRRPGFEMSVLHRRADRLAVLLGIVVVPVTGLALSLVGPVLGPEFESGRKAMVILFGAAAVTTASAPYRALITTNGSDRIVGLATLSIASFSAICSIALISNWGMEGAATSALLAQLVMLAFLICWSLQSRRRGIGGYGAAAASMESA